MTSGAKMRRKTLSIFWVPERNVLHTWHRKYVTSVAIMLRAGVYMPHKVSKDGV